MANISPAVQISQGAMETITRLRKPTARYVLGSPKLVVHRHPVLACIALKTVIICVKIRIRTNMSAPSEIVIIGAGPAGLTAAYGLAGGKAAPLVIEKSGAVGGIARTEEYKGFLFDIGGHRFHTDIQEIEAIWRDVLGPDLLEVPRVSHILYRGRLLKYPLRVGDTLRKIGLGASITALASYLWSRVAPPPDLENLEQWLISRFGRRIYRTFFKDYSEKVWGLPCTEIQADWASQRIQGLSLAGAVVNALVGRKTAHTLIDRFLYPRLGAGMMWREMARRISSQGGRVELGWEVLALEMQGNRVAGLRLGNGRETRHIDVHKVISSMPLPHLIQRMEPPPGPELLAAARSLRFRSFILVGLILESEMGADHPWQWLYVHDAALKVGRVQNYRNWSPDMISEPGKTSLGMEYFCTQGDEFWSMADLDLIALATHELNSIWPGLGKRVIDGVVFRQPHAYPVYHRGYQQVVNKLGNYIGGISNLITIGRSGLHRYNNQDHSMMTGLRAARRLRDSPVEKEHAPPAANPAQTMQRVSESPHSAIGAMKG